MPRVRVTAASRVAAHNGSAAGDRACNVSGAGIAVATVAATTAAAAVAAASDDGRSVLFRAARGHRSDDDLLGCGQLLCVNTQVPGGGPKPVGLHQVPDVPDGEGLAGHLLDVVGEGVDVGDLLAEQAELLHEEGLELVVVLVVGAPELQHVLNGGPALLD